MTHALVGVTAAFVCYATLGALFPVLGFPKTIHPAVGAPLAIAVSLFWVLMLTDFFRNGVPKGRVVWGTCLIGLCFIGALPYFWRVWRPRHAVRTSPNNALEQKREG